MKIFDLSLPISNDMPGVQITIAKRLEVEGWNATTLQLYSHCGTHMDAPKHFLPGGCSIDEQNLQALIGPALVVNLSPVKPKQLLQISDFAGFDSFIVPGARILLRTDWYKRFGTPEYRQDLPRISLELAEWFVERRIALLGVEPPSVADVNNKQELTEVHQALLLGSVVIVEGLANLDQLPTPMVEFIALPLRVVGGDGTPVRAIARVEE